jgi:hypothetical protein
MKLTPVRRMPWSIQLKYPNRSPRSLPYVKKPQLKRPGESPRAPILVVQVRKFETRCLSTFEASVQSIINSQPWRASQSPEVVPAPRLTNRASAVTCLSIVVLWCVSSQGQLPRRSRVVSV